MGVNFSGLESERSRFILQTTGEDKGFVGWYKNPCWEIPALLCTYLCLLIVSIKCAIHLNETTPSGVKRLLDC